jgi:nondiscriminating aspartyl-tRNA synthetase
LERIWTKQIASHAGQRIQLDGWFHHLRQHRAVAFLVLRDGSGLAQVVLDDPDLASSLSRLPRESVLRIVGRVTPEPQAPGGFEIREAAVDVIARADQPPPVELFRPSLSAQLPAILDHAPVALRHPRQRAIFRIAAAAVDGFRRSLREQRFVEIQTPKIVGSATEGGANVFSVDYLGRPAYLAQSPQLYKQIMVGVFERVFETGPVFRAEPHDTPRHLNEYVSLDAEMAFIGDHTSVMETLTGVVREMVHAIRNDASDEVALRGATLPYVPPSIPSIHFADAQRLIARATGEAVGGEPDLSPGQERWLGEWAKETQGSDFLFVVGYPMAKRPFYTHPDPQRPEFSNSFDLLFRGLELSTGGQRLNLYPDYVAALANRGMDLDSMSWYLEAFRHGMPPHGGFAIGLERWVAQIIGAPNVRETTLFPRDLHRLVP